MTFFKIIVLKNFLVFHLFFFVGSINDLYESILQREYTGPIPLLDHQVERKAVRSPSLRLRFGRRSDPNLMPLGVS